MYGLDLDDQSRSPSGIKRENAPSVETGPTYGCIEVNGQVTLFHSWIQHQGPDDPRLDRFARVLAHAGYVVGVPALPTMIDLRMEPELLEDVRKAFMRFSSLSSGKIAVFSISASSIAGLQLGTRSETASLISQIMLFGGYSDWAEALTFALDGRIDSRTQLQIDP